MQNIFPMIMVPTLGGRFYFSPEEIVRLEASGNYTLIYFTNKKPMLTTKLLKEYENLLGSQGFIRTHRSHLVNKRYIRFVDESGHITMRDASRAELSRRKKNEVLRALLAA